MKNYYVYTTPVGELRFEDNGRAITCISLAGQKCDPAAARNETPLIKEARKQINEYFEGERTQFALPLEPEGTDFQLKVWEALRQIPYGQTRTYGQIAACVDNPRGSRAVGMANNRNPVMIVIPCHRVIGSTGKLTGYACGLDKKELLLDLEQKHK